MPGKKRFNEDAALDAAMAAFWRNGYDGTSLADLEAATGLNKSSLYNAFDSKEALFERCLERYGMSWSAALLDALDAPSLVAGLRAMLGAMVERSDAQGCPKGCLATIAAMETVSEGDVVAERLAAGLDAMRRRLVERFSQAIDDGELAASANAEHLASMTIAVSRGVAVLDRTPGADAVARQAIVAFIATIEGLGAGCDDTQNRATPQS